MNDSAGYNLAHPIYLDVPMMLSFLAHLEGGVSVSETETSTVSGAKERFLRGRTGLRAKLWTLGEAEMSGEGGTQKRDETSTQAQTERHHTAASLFNLLHDYLNADPKIKNLEDSSQLSGLSSGELVEVSGEYLGNPIEDILAFVNALSPYLQGDKNKPVQVARSGKNQRSGNPAARAAAANPGPSAAADEGFDAMQLIKQMHADIAKAPVHDLLFRTEQGMEAVVTAASEYYSDSTHEYLRAGNFRVIGKVTRVIKDDDLINLTRRTVLGAAGPEMAKEMISSFTSTDGLSLDVASPVVAGPAVQILPMAIFI